MYVCMYVCMQIYVHIIYHIYIISSFYLVDPHLWAWEHQGLDGHRMLTNTLKQLGIHGW